ncbi:hypothetical protein [Undibacterium sp. Ren11W]|uniref:hypothetical protein n=1 Tax=Undibacterium sp. Ren11W TaxID=3413045 RepID=UPI003BF3A7AA
MHGNTVFSYHFTNAGNALFDTALIGGDAPQGEIVRPHEFVFVYQAQDTNEANWNSLTEMIRDRLLVYSLEIALLDNHQDQSQKRIAVVHKHGYLIVQSMAYEGAVGEFNFQHILEFGFAPVLTRHIDLLRTLKALEFVMKTGY